MKHIRLCKSTLCGSLKVPPSKSLTQRAILFAALSTGISRLENVLFSPDTFAMMLAMEQFGARFLRKGTVLFVQGNSGIFEEKTRRIDAGNSGIVLRFVLGLCSLVSSPSIIFGDDSLCKRPLQPLIDAYKALGCMVFETNGSAPVSIQGPIVSSSTSVCGADSQFVSSLLIAGAFSPTPLEFSVISPGEKPFVDMTLFWFDLLHIPYKRVGYEYFFCYGNNRYNGFSYAIPLDISSALFPIVAALITNSSICIQNYSKDHCQGDIALFDMFCKMGAVLHIDEEKNTLYVKKHTGLSGAVFDMNDCIDALPIMAVLGCAAAGETILYNASVARTKESNRIQVICQELRKMGATIEETVDGLHIKKSTLHGAIVSSHKDHRIAMTLAVAGLYAEGETIVMDTACIDKTYPSFVQTFASLGAQIKT